MDESEKRTVPDATARPKGRTDDVAATERERELEEIVAEFILKREEGEEPAIEDLLARHPRYAEDLAFLLSDLAGASPPLTLPDAARGHHEIVHGPLRRLGPYEILEQVAQGGGGTVYRARHHEEHHLVALKVLDKLAVGDARDFERFEREAKMLRSMDLVAVVPVYDVGEDQDRLYIAMKWIEGSNLVALREAVADSAHPFHDLRERARLLARIARTFGAVHGYGILHRDVKPSNILVDRLGEPALIDFGIAHASAMSELTMTMDGPMGTPRYIAPELLESGNAAISPQADIYGLGLCLYELVTGVPAFFQKQRADLFQAIQHAGPSAPRTIQRSIPFALEAIILRAIAIPPARRYASMNDFAADLERFAKGDLPEPATLRHAHPLRRFVLKHRRTLAAGAAILVLVSAVGVWAVLKIADRAFVNACVAELEGWDCMPFEAFSEDALKARSAALQLRERDVDDQGVRRKVAWIELASGEAGAALDALGAPAEGEERANRLLRAYLNLRIEREASKFLEGASVTSKHPTGKSSDGKGFGDRFDAEIMDRRAVSEAAERRAAKHSPLTREALDPVLVAHPATTPAEHFLRAALLFDGLPSGLDPELVAVRTGEIKKELEVVLIADPDHVWAHFIRATIALRYGDPKDAADDAEALAHAPAMSAAATHLRALCLAKFLTEKGDARLASTLFERAAGLYEKRFAASPDLKADPVAVDPLRKLFGAWASHEAWEKNADRAREVLARWRRYGFEGFFGDDVFPAVFEARIQLAEGKTEEALLVLRHLAEAHPNLALIPREAARIREDVLHEDDRPERLRQLAASLSQQSPESLDTWMSGNFFGLRPYSAKRFFEGYVFDPLRDGKPLPK